jgi:hypothetical protein
MLAMDEASRVRRLDRSAMRGPDGRFATLAHST